MNKTTLINLLKTTQEKTLGYSNLSEKYLLRTYGTGKWNIKQILIHLSDAESILHNRLKRIISNPNQVIWAYDQDQWENVLQYHS